MTDIQPEPGSDRVTGADAPDAQDENVRLRAEIDRLNAEMSRRNQQPGGQADQPEQQTTFTTEEPETSPVIGAAPDPRGGFVIAHANGKVNLVNVPKNGQDDPQPWGEAPSDKQYSHFFVSNDGNSYNFVVDGEADVATVNNPIQHLPVGVVPPPEANLPRQ